MNDTLSDDIHAELKASLRRCSADTIEAAIRFREHGDLQAIPIFVFGILDRYQPSTATIKLADAAEDARLIGDIGLDSLTLLEIVMSIEEVLKISIANEELREIKTIGQLNQFLQTKVSAPGPAAKLANSASQ